MQLIQSTKENALWARLRTSWDKQLKHYGAPGDWVVPQLDHAEKIIQDADPRYGIYVACGGKLGMPSAPYDGFIHVNFKLPNTTASEIRLVWNRVAPRFQFEDLRADVVEIQSTFIFGAMELSQVQGRKIPVKMFLGNPIDQAFGRSFSQIVSRMSGMQISAAVRGNWMHISWL